MTTENQFPCHTPVAGRVWVDCMSTPQAPHRLAPHHPQGLQSTGTPQTGLMVLYPSTRPQGMPVHARHWHSGVGEGPHKNLRESEKGQGSRLWHSSRVHGGGVEEAGGGGMPPGWIAGWSWGAPIGLSPRILGGVFARCARAQRGHSANYYGDYPGNNPENHPPAESCKINSKLKNSNI